MRYIGGKSFREDKDPEDSYCGDGSEGISG